MDIKGIFQKPPDQQRRRTVTLDDKLAMYELQSMTPREIYERDMNIVRRFNRSQRGLETVAGAIAVSALVFSLFPGLVGNSNNENRSPETGIENTNPVVVEI